jgi:hypothetical protein
MVWISTGLFLLGFAALIRAAWLIAPWVGWGATGVLLIFLALWPVFRSVLRDLSQQRGG